MHKDREEIADIQHKQDHPQVRGTHPSPFDFWQLVAGIGQAHKQCDIETVSGGGWVGELE